MKDWKDIIQLPTDKEYRKFINKIKIMEILSMRIEVGGIEIEIVGSFKEEDREEVEEILMYYDFYTMWIDNLAQRNEARSINNKKEVRLEELGIKSFKKIGLID